MSMTIANDTGRELKTALVSINESLTQHGLMIQRLSDRMDNADKDRDLERDKKTRQPVTLQGWIAIVISVVAIVVAGICSSGSMLIGWLTTVHK